uniref:efflux RND transporter periplasmic adaptor subunit n=1 Tax=Microbulbifer agarilyticus TaxID=260552 RepID=UPI000255B5AE|nr:HlyD family secretion protein [Microbulbifer agarilyticus]
MDARLLKRLNSFLALEKKLRQAANVAQVAQIACSDSQFLLNFDTCLFFSGSRLTLTAASNVSAVDNTACDTQRWQKLVRENIQQSLDKGPLEVAIPSPPPIDRQHVDPQHTDSQENNKAAASGQLMVLMPLDAPDNAYSRKRPDLGCIALLRRHPLSPQELEVFRELAAAVRQALLALRGTKSFSLRRWIQRRPLIFAAAIIAVSLLPVRQSVLAPASLAAIEPRIVSARTDGVIRTIDVPPNARVDNTQLLFTLEDAEVTAEIDRVQQEIALYSERLRMARQYNFQQTAAGYKLAQAETDLFIRKLDLEFQHSQLEKTRIRAPSSGVAIYTDPAAWIGRRIRAGEKVMEIVQPNARRIQIDLPTSDAIALPETARVMFYAESNPLTPIAGHLTYHSLLTSEGENQPASYRLLAAIEQDQPHIRINTRGHARIYGARVPLVYYLLRKPISTARRWLGV